MGNSKRRPAVNNDTFEQAFWSEMEEKAKLEELTKSTQDISDILWQRDLEERRSK
jgi:hypothetical protein